MDSMVAQLQELIDRKSNSLSIFLNKRYGINESPTPLLLLSLHSVYGDSFLEDLSIVFDDDDTDLVHFGPDTTTQVATDGKPSTLDKLKNLFGVAKAAAGVIKSTTSKPASTTAPAKDQSQADTTKKIILIGAIVIVVLIVIVIVVKKLKK